MQRAPVFSRRTFEAEREREAEKNGSELAASDPADETADMVLQDVILMIDKEHFSNAFQNFCVCSHTGSNDTHTHANQHYFLSLASVDNFKNERAFGFFLVSFFYSLYM